MLVEETKQLMGLATMAEKWLSDAELPDALSACNAWNDERAAGTTAYLHFADDGRADLQISGGLDVDAGLTATVEDFCKYFPNHAVQALRFLHNERGI